MCILQVRKRDGRMVGFDAGRIRSAVSRAMAAAREGNPSVDSVRVSEAVVREIGRRFPAPHIPGVEDIQDLVEETLILQDFAKTAKAYILYRYERAKIREKASEVPEAVRRKVLESKRYFKTPLSEFVFYRTYSRWMEEEGRRETWAESVSRYMRFMREELGGRLSGQEYERIERSILEQEVMPSMRLLWSAGPAARATHAAAYNCAYVAPSGPGDLAEILYLLMCGTGVGFSVESQSVQQLPIVRRQRGVMKDRHFVGDSKEGWADALKIGLESWYDGSDLEFDFSRVRPAGARLLTMGGRSSGPDPLKEILKFARELLLSRQGRRLRSIDVHDLVCKIGEGVAMGGVRRSALISLSDPDDREMREAKAGHFYLNHPERAVANNSAAYDRKPRDADFLEEWLALVRSGTGERGIFNRGSLPLQLPLRRFREFSSFLPFAGTNPCGEIVLRSKEFCNLTEVIARPEDSERSLLAKMEVACILGTYQATLTSFPYISAEWKKNCEEERLLGVSITGQWDSEASRDPAVLRRLKERAIEVNRAYASRFGIREAAAVTCVKPSGTVSQLVDSSSGLHPRHAKYYLRRVRISALDPLFKMLKDQKFPHRPEIGQVDGQATTYVLEFPVRAPENAVVRDDLSAVELLEHWRKVKLLFTEHNPSVTVAIGEGEWIKAADWLYGNWDLLGGLSFLPRTEAVYPLAPYEKISREEYDKRLAELPEIDFSRIVLYEREDQTTGRGFLACAGGTCELDPEEGSYPRQSGPQNAA